jgi:hypothetical protein
MAMSNFSTSSPSAAKQCTYGRFAYVFNPANFACEISGSLYPPRITWLVVYPDAGGNTISRALASAKIVKDSSKQDISKLYVEDETIEKNVREMLATYDILNVIAECIANDYDSLTSASWGKYNRYVPLIVHGLMLKCRSDVLIALHQTSSPLEVHVFVCSLYVYQWAVKDPWMSQK